MTLAPLSINRDPDLDWLIALEYGRVCDGHRSEHWAWCFLGQACEAAGDTAEARAAYAHAVELQERGAAETDAPERLAHLEGDRR